MGESKSIQLSHLECALVANLVRPPDTPHPPFAYTELVLGVVCPEDDVPHSAARVSIVRPARAVVSYVPVSVLVVGAEGAVRAGAIPFCETWSGEVSMEPSHGVAVPWLSASFECRCGRVRVVE